LILQPHVSVLYQLLMVDEWNDNWQGKAKVLRAKSAVVPFCASQTHTDYIGLNSGLPW
jgi:hypothetical protein